MKLEKTRWSNITQDIDDRRRRRDNSLRGWAENRGKCGHVKIKNIKTQFHEDTPGKDTPSVNAGLFYYKGLHTYSYCTYQRGKIICFLGPVII